jgi:hypothetical protein
MAEYRRPPLELEPTAVAQDAFNFLQDAIPGWTPNPAALDTLIIHAFSEPAALAAEVASVSLDDDFRSLGPLVGVPARDATPATITVTLNAASAATDRTIDAFSVVGLRSADDELIGFLTDTDATIVAGATSTTVSATAELEGVVGNGLSGVAELVSTPGFVTSAAVSAPSAGGTDAEDDATYMDRLSETLTLLSPRPILPNDFAVLARSVPGVFRAMALDGYKPGPPYDAGAASTGNARMITVAVADAGGLDPGPAVRASVQATLDAEREVNFTVWVIAPTYTNIDVAFTVRAWPNYTVADVQARAAAAVADFLSPATWASGPTGDATTWYPDPTSASGASVVRFGELYEVLNAVQGVRYVEAVTLGVHGGALAATDVTLPGPAALPTAGTITPTVNPG